MVDLQFLHQAKYLRMPWKNGCGITSEIAVGGSGDDFIWRLSAAEVASSGPFSRFPGVDRKIVVLSAHGMRLRLEGRTIELAPLEPYSFDGDAETVGELTAGPVRDLNLMTRRGEAQGSMAVLRVTAASHDLHLQEGTTFLHALAPLAIVRDERLHLLASGDTLRVDAGEEPFPLRLWSKRDASLIHVNIRMLKK
jgi:environmental stress-induced protein Ves